MNDASNILKEVFNIIVEFIDYIDKNAEKSIYEMYDARAKKEIKRINELLKRYLENILLGVSGTITLNENTIDKSIVKALKELYNYLTESNDINSMIQTVMYLDKSLETVMKDLVMVYERKNTSIEYINTNWEEKQIGLLPRCSCQWERSHQGSQYHHRIDNYMHNILYIDLKRMGNFKIEHTFMNLKNRNEIGKRGELNIAVSPIQQKCPFEVTAIEDEKSRGFDVVYNGDKQKNNEKILDIMSLAASYEVDILVFPEMLGNEDTLEVVQEQLQVPTFEFRYPMITVLPSVWKNNENYVHIINRYGRLLFTQRKQFSYSENGQRENIIPDYIIHVLHCKGLGRIIVMICRDFLEVPHLQNIIYCIKPTLILVPSYSTGNFDFQQVEGICRSADCCVIWANSCAAIKNKKCIGFVQRSGYGNFTGKEQRVDFEPCENFHNRDCEQVCLKVESINYQLKEAIKF